MKVTRNNLFTGKVNTREIDITELQLDTLNLRDRRPIQELLPHLSADDREFLMTGCTPEEWDEMFKE